ncbi:hypothetical protein C8P68_107218 [Mucilaginibacter yixingensis]|uniref:Uncharacterized protein n=1 Tax=Mucilaginibacter yixingensis TaxID=1295612 RepID=A0A2T5J6I3_9SPHI|nr:HAD domain-containing protein [Mucilaginibacter yixingensis]PTQ94152.1 hypothetical protein C8P68_107218 [Mucilaginibacter yixingensis]
MTILLDMDGVLITEPPWKKVEIADDGFIQFNPKAAKCLSEILSVTNAAIVLTTTHRINFSLDEWMEIFRRRSLFPASISKVNDVKSVADMDDRYTEVLQWVEKFGAVQNYVIIDDDASLNKLPAYIKNKCVITKSFIGIDEQAKQRVLDILL